MRFKNSRNLTQRQKERKHKEFMRDMASPTGIFAQSIICFDSPSQILQINIYELFFDLHKSLFFIGKIFTLIFASLYNLQIKQ